MADGRTEQAPVEDAPKSKAAAKAADPVYPASEVINAARNLFGVNPEVVVGALAAAGRPSEITIPDAKAAVSRFLRTKKGE